jgi:hypothetical protein
MKLDKNKVYTSDRGFCKIVTITTTSHFQNVATFRTLEDGQSWISVDMEQFKEVKGYDTPLWKVLNG